MPNDLVRCLGKDASFCTYWRGRICSVFGSNLFCFKFFCFYFVGLHTDICAWVGHRPMATRAWGHLLANHDQAWSHRKALKQCKLNLCVQVDSLKGLPRFKRLLLCQSFRQYSGVDGKFGIDMFWILAFLLLKSQVCGELFWGHNRQLLHRCNSCVCAADVCFWQATLCVHKFWFGEKCVAMAMLYKDSKWLQWGARISLCTSTTLIFKASQPPRWMSPKPKQRSKFASMMGLGKPRSSMRTEAFVFCYSICRGYRLTPDLSCFLIWVKSSTGPHRRGLARLLCSVRWWTGRAFLKM